MSQTLANSFLTFFWQVSSKPLQLMVFILFAVLLPDNNLLEVKGQATNA